MSIFERNASIAPAQRADQHYARLVRLLRAAQASSSTPIQPIHSTGFVARLRAALAAHYLLRNSRI